MPRKNRHHEIPQVCTVNDRLEKTMMKQVEVMSRELALLTQIAEDTRKILRLLEVKK